MRYNDKTMMYKNLIAPILAHYFPRGKIYLFGSRAKGTAREGSDIDIAIDIGCVLDIPFLFQVKSALDELDIPVKIDLLDYQTAHDALKEEIITHGVVWNF